MPEDESILRTRRALMQDRAKVREWYREAKAYLAEQRQPAAEKIPRGTINYILGNMVLWDVLIVVLYVASGGKLIHAPVLLVGLALALVIMLLVQMLIWRFFWFLVAVQWTCATIIAAVAVMAVVTGAVRIHG